MSEPERFRVALHDNVACNESIHRLYSRLLRNLTICIQSEGESVVYEFGNVHMAGESDWMGLELSSDGLINVDEARRLSAGDERGDLSAESAELCAL